MSAPLRVWCLLRDQFAHVQPVEEYLGARAEFTYDAEWDPSRLVAARPDVVVCVNDWPYDVARCLDAARAAGIPSVVLQDGILEWRCQYENPLFGAGGGAPQHQPVLADRIACIGAQSARQIAAWGNAGKVVTTGMPRLDHLLAHRPPPPRRPAQTVLVMTAKNHGFTDAQRRITVQSLRDVQAHLSSVPDIQVLWRVRESVAQALGVENQMRETSSVELKSVLDRADAVITTPSTALLEVMLLGRPVAALDYHNTPRFVPTAWTISAAEQVPAVVAELRDPPAAKMAFQRDCLDDCLECRSPAAPRVAALLMQLAGREADPARDPRLPAGAPLPVLSALYPGGASFAPTDVQALQVRLARLQKELERTRAQLKMQGMLARFGRWAHVVIGRNSRDSRRSGVS